MKTYEEMQKMLYRDCVSAGGQSAWARKHKVSAQFISDVLRGNKKISASVANKLGYRRQMVFTPIANDHE